MCVERGPAHVAGHLFDLQQFHVEREHGVRRNDARMATAAVRVVRRADQLGALANGQL